MNQKLDIPIPVEQEQAKYIPFCDFREKMRTEGQSPYVSELSFDPLMDKVRTRLAKSNLQKLRDMEGLLRKAKKDFMRTIWEEFENQESEDIETLIDLMFPAMFLQSQMGFMGVPFTSHFVYQTKMTKEFMFSEKYEVRLDKLIKEKSFSPIQHITNFLLEKYYGQSLGSRKNDRMIVRDKETGIVQYFQLEIITDYIRMKFDRPLPELSEQEIQALINDPGNGEMLLKFFPPKDFSFEGFVVGNIVDTTRQESILTMQDKMVKGSTDIAPQEIYEEIESIVKSFLRMPEIHFGSLLVSANKEPMSEDSWTLLKTNNKQKKINVRRFSRGIYGRVCENGESIIINDLGAVKEPDDQVKVLVKKGLKSLLLAPLYDMQNNLIGVFEIASPKARQFNRNTLIDLGDLIDIYALGTARYIGEFNNQVALFVQKQFTSIHPSVKWKFNEVAQEYLQRQRSYDEKEETLKPIVFKDVYPLYAQADIVGSSNLRNESIVADFIENLEQAIHVMSTIRGLVRFHLLEVYIAKSTEILTRLKKGEFTSSDESLVMGMLISEIHPLLKELVAHFRQIPAKLVSDYFNLLDPQLGILYLHRKDYEDSVSQLNNVLAHYMEEEDQKMQKVLPHFFEKYSTDGIEYNIYLGQSLLPQGQFSTFFLKDFRVWQMLNMVKITRKVQELSPMLPVPLQTAQLIFVYNNSMSIRFKMEEKQFDVDGTYNVRYEILKKRIDKALVKGTGERLTQAGKIAIVWLQEEDRQEYLVYIDHLISQGYLHPEVEQLELDKLQGAEGLKALRVTVI